MWARLINAALGAWLMAAPHVLGYGNLAATVAHVAGPVILGSSVVAAWPVLRPLRWVSLAAGVCVFASALFLGGATVAVANGCAVGALAVALSFAGGETGKSFGGGWSSLTGMRQER